MVRETATQEGRVETIAHWLGVFVQPGQVVELRALGVGERKAVHAFFQGDRLADMARQALRWEEQGARSVRFTLNLLRADVAESRRFVNGDDVVGRRWLLVDCEPVDHAKDVPASEEGRQAAWEVLQRCRGCLECAGAAGAVVGDSGNGWHLLYPLDLPNDDAAKTLVKTVLAGLRDHCSDEAARVDPETYRSIEAAKVYGTLSRKGQATPERPHRWSQLIEGVPWDPETARGNNGALGRLLVIWQKQDEVRRGRERAALSAAQKEEERRQHYAQTALEREAGKVASAPENDRNNQLNRSAFALGQLIGGGELARADVESALREAGRRAGLPDAEVGLTMKSGIEAGLKQPRSAPEGNGHHGGQAARNGRATCATGVGTGAAPAPEPESEPWEAPVPLSIAPEPMPFPLDVLPPALARFVGEVAWALNCPVDFAAVPLLAVAGGAVGNSRRLAITHTHLQSSCLFAAVVGAPGSAKSPALDHILEPIEQAQERYLRDWREAVRAHEGEGPELALRRCLVDDTTTEALVDRLTDNPRGVLMSRRELAALVTGMNQYRSGGHGHDRQVYLKLWAHESIYSDRKSNPDQAPVSVRRPFVGIVGGIQPSVVNKLRGDEPGAPPADDGFLDRFLFSWPAELPAVEERWRDVSQQATASWDAAVQHLLGLPMTQGEYGPRPFLVRLDVSGQGAWVRFTREHANEVNDEDFPDFLKGPWAKLRGYCGRLALIVHHLREASGEVGISASEVDGASVDRAAQLVAYFKSHARKIYAAMDADPVVPRARRILRWIAREERAEFKRRELWMDVKSRQYFPRPDDLDGPLARLIRHDYLRLQPASKRAGPGRPPSDTYEVNPILYVDPQKHYNPPNSETHVPSHMPEHGSEDFNVSGEPYRDKEREEDFPGGEVSF